MMMSDGELRGEILLLSSGTGEGSWRCTARGQEAMWDQA